MDLSQKLILMIGIVLILLPATSGHGPGLEEAFVRVVDADPSTRTYTFSCVTSPDNAHDRDWFIRPDDGISGGDPEEATILDLAHDEYLTYTFQDDTFYHIGCFIWNPDGSGNDWRGDLHIDLRDGETWNPNLQPLSGSGLSATFQCTAQSGATPSWEALNAQTGERTDLGSGDQKTYTAPGHGLFDIFCTADGNTVGIPTEFFDAGDPYFPDHQGVPHGVTTEWNRGDGPDPPPQENATITVHKQVINDDEGTSEASDFTLLVGATQVQDGQPTNVPTGTYMVSEEGPAGYSASFSGDCTADGTITLQEGDSKTCTITNDDIGSSGACFESVGELPATCSGTITQDTTSGDCRTLTCDGLQVLACNKPDEQNPQHFEMYKQTSTTGVELCLHQTCISTNGYAKSQPYPICTNDDGDDPSPICGNDIIETGEQCDDGNTAPGDGCSSTCEIESSACHEDLASLPATCEGGTITQDVMNGCRSITCQSGNGDMNALACSKQDSQGTYFEMYEHGATDQSLDICLGETCLDGWGYRMGDYFPICTNDDGDDPSPICGNDIIETGEQCDDGNTAPGDGCSSTCETEQEQVCHESVANIPATCSGTITQDTTSGDCRTLTCDGLQVLACNKPDEQNPQHFEMYKQTSTTGVELCLHQTCISTNGYAKSQPYPICTNDDGDDPPPQETEGITWIEPSEGLTGVSPTAFHLNVEVPDNETSIPTTEWELWSGDESERVWYALNSGQIRFHTHTPDGAFEGNRAGTGMLAHSTTYKVRMRYNHANGTDSEWSAWRTFTTAADESFPGAPMWSVPEGFAVERFATGFDVPVHIAFAPDNLYAHLPESERPYFYVTELYGTVKVVYRDGSQSVYADNLLNFPPFGSITGGGQMGTVGLYIDPADGDLYVSTVYIENEDEVYNKILHFTTSSDGSTHTSQEIVIDGIPGSPSHQIQQITEGPDGKLYVGIGDALNEGNAQDDGVYAGKIIRMNKDGSNIEVYAKGLRNPFGSDWRPGSGMLYATDNAPDSDDRLLRIEQGHNYLWGDGNLANDAGEAIWLLNVSPGDVEFNPGGNGFPPELDGRMYVAVAGPIFQQGPTQGKEILEFTLDSGGGIVGARQFLRYTGEGYGTPIGLDFGPDGLYFTDIYGEPGFVGLGETEANVYRIVQGTADPCTDCTGQFRTGIQIAPWYPKDHGSEVEYIFECNGIDGSGDYKYDFHFGDGQHQWNFPPNHGTGRRADHTYPDHDQDYVVSCTAHDQSTGESESASLIVNPSHFIPE